MFFMKARAVGLRETVVVSVVLFLIFPALLAASVAEGADLPGVPDWLLPGLLTLVGGVMSAFTTAARRPRTAADEEPEGEGNAPEEAAAGTGAGTGELGTEVHRSLRPDTVIAHRMAIERAVLAMHERLDEDLTLKELASRAFISPYHFNRVFRQLVGIPPCQFLGALRLQEAKRLLLTTRLRITDICFQVGYSSLGTFTRRFTSLVGFSPRQFRALAGRPPLPLSELGGLAAGPWSAGPEAAVSGQIQTATSFRGAAFVGMFDSPIPQGPPAACALAGAPGPFTLPACPDGDYHLLAVGLTPVGDGLAQVLFQGMPRGGDEAGVLRVRGGRASRPAHVDLRPPDLIDPPILITPYLFLQQHMAGAATGMPREWRRAFEQSRRSLLAAN